MTALIAPGTVPTAPAAPTSVPDDPVGEHPFTVSIDGCTRRQAEQVLPRLLHLEDLNWGLSDPESSFDYDIRVIGEG